VQVIHRVAAALDEVPGSVIVVATPTTCPSARRASRPTGTSRRSAPRPCPSAGRLAARPPAPASRGPRRQRPRRPNNTAEGRAQNRRVEIVLLVAPQQRDQQLQALPAAPETRN
jgi:type VI secretion system protein ImpK